MSVADSTPTEKPGTNSALVHDVKLAIYYRDKTTGTQVDVVRPMLRNDVGFLMAHLAKAIDHMFENADEGADGVISVVLLRRSS